MTNKMQDEKEWLDTQSETASLLSNESDSSIDSENASFSEHALDVLDKAIMTAQEDIAQITMQIQKLLEKNISQTQQLQEQFLKCKQDLHAAEKQSIAVGSSTLQFFENNAQTKARLELERAKKALETVNKKLDALREPELALLKTKHDLEQNLQDFLAKREKIQTGQAINLGHTITYAVENSEPQKIISSYEQSLEDYKNALEPLVQAQKKWDASAQRRQELSLLYDALCSMRRDLSKQLDEALQWQAAYQLSIKENTVQIGTHHNTLLAQTAARQTQNLFIQLMARMYISFLHIFGYQSKEEKQQALIQDAINELTAQNNVLEDNLKVIADDLASFQQDLETTSERIISTKKEIDDFGVKPNTEEIGALTQQILAAQLILADIPLILQSCKVDSSLGLLRDKEHKDAVMVKEKLKDFLENPTDRTLAVLQTTMTNHPNYKTGLDLVDLLERTNKIYPQVSIRAQVDQLHMSDYLLESQKKQITQNTHLIQTLEQERESLSQEIRQQRHALLQKNDVIATNKQALTVCYRLLYLFHKTEKARKHNSETDELHGLLGVKLLLEEKIHYIESELDAASIIDVEHTCKDLEKNLGALLSYEGFEDKVLQILSANNDFDLPLPKILTPKQVEEFLSQFEPLKQKEIHAKIKALPEFQKKLSNQASEIIELTNTLINAITETEQYYESCVQTIYDAIDHLGHVLSQSKAIQPYEKALLIFNHTQEKDFETALDKFRSAIDEFPKSVKTDYKIEIDALDEARNHFKKPILRTLFKEHIRWIEHTGVSSLDRAYQKNQAALQDLSERINTLIATNEQLKGDIQVLSDGNVSNQQKRVINDLVKQLEKPLYLDNAVRIALKEFLCNPTTPHLHALQTMMEKTPHYQQNSKLMPLVESAGLFYSEIIEAHHAAIEKIKSNPSQTSILKFGLDVLRGNSTEELNMPNSAPNSFKPSPQ